jgi:dolichyl-phosphate-mannose--protein O-mannosyl transferase
VRIVFRLFAAFFFCAACYHGAGLLVAINEAPWWRHLLFVGIDLGCAVGFLYRPAWFVWLFAGLTIQQGFSHGAPFWFSLAKQGTIKWMDGGIVLFLFAALACLVVDARQKRRARTHRPI